MVLIFVGVALLGALLVIVGLSWIRGMGARMSIGTRLAGARELPVGEVARLSTSPARPVRISGRIRCNDPLIAPDGEQLVAFRRDVEVRLPSGEWRTIERLRENRSFELWDHAGSQTLDPSQAADPLVAIPRVWEGDPAELEGQLAASIARLTSQDGTPVAARAVTRLISDVDRLLVLAEVDVDPQGRARLTPPPGGFVISTLELDAAMRLLGGSHRRQLPIAIAVLICGTLLVAAGLVAAAVSWIVAA